MSNKPRQERATLLAKQFQCVSKDLRTMQAACLVGSLADSLAGWLTWPECVTSTSWARRGRGTRVRGNFGLADTKAGGSFRMQSERLVLPLLVGRNLLQLLS